MLAVCDVDDANLAQARKMWPDAATFKDFRKLLERDDIHVIVNGTPDHWHTLVNIAAMKAGKDVYSEKPLTLTIDEGKRLVQVVRDTKRILQTGSQQRSDKNFRLACELVRNGRLGKLKHVDVWLPHGRREGPFMKAAVPAGLDWDMWLGQTPQVDYVTRALPPDVPLLVGILGRHDDRLGRSSSGYRPVGHRPRTERAGQRRGQAARRDDSRRLHGVQRVRSELRAMPTA